MVPRHFHQGTYIYIYIFIYIYTYLYIYIHFFLINDCSTAWTSFMIYQPAVRAKDALTAVSVSLCPECLDSASNGRLRYVTFAAAREDLCQHGRMPQVTGGGGGKPWKSCFVQHFSKMLLDGPFGWYCWWTKSCTTKDDAYPIVGFLTIPAIAGFLPSTVLPPQKRGWNSYTHRRISIGTVPKMEESSPMFFSCMDVRLMDTGVSPPPKVALKISGSGFQPLHFRY